MSWCCQRRLGIDLSASSRRCPGPRPSSSSGEPSTAWRRVRARLTEAGLRIRWSNALAGQMRRRKRKQPDEALQPGGCRPEPSPRSTPMVSHRLTSTNCLRCRQPILCAPAWNFSGQRAMVLGPFILAWSQCWSLRCLLRTRFFSRPLTSRRSPRLLGSTVRGLRWSVSTCWSRGRWPRADRGVSLPRRRDRCPWTWSVGLLPVMEDVS